MVGPSRRRSQTPRGYRRLHQLLALPLLLAAAACAGEPAPADFDETLLGAMSAAEASPVTLHEVGGSPELTASFEEALQNQMDEGPLTFSAHGVRELFIDANVVDETATTEDGEIQVRVKASLLMLDQPTNAIRGSLSASAMVTLSAEATPEAQQAMKEEAAEALAASLYRDLAKFVASP
jgi:hypothetical protein